MKGLLERQWNKFDEVESVKEFTYLCDRLSAGGGCKAFVTAIARCWWVKFRKCSELLYGKRFSLELKGSVYESYIRPTILCGSEAWCLKESRWEFYEGQKDPW